MRRRITRAIGGLLFTGTCTYIGRFATRTPTHGRAARRCQRRLHFSRDAEQRLRSTIAARAAGQTGMPFIVSFVCDRDARLLSSENLVDAAREMTALEPIAILVNCLPPNAVTNALRQLQRASDLPVGAYANTSEYHPKTGWTPTEAEAPVMFADVARSWLQAGAKIVRGCCGTTPNHIAYLRDVIREPR